MMDIVTADSINGVRLNWEEIEKLDLEKGKNTKEEALNIIFKTFFVEGKEMVPVRELITQRVFKYIDANFQDVKTGIIRTFGNDKIVEVGRKKQLNARIRRRFKDIPESSWNH